MNYYKQNLFIHVTTARQGAHQSC